MKLLRGDQSVVQRKVWTDPTRTRYSTKWGPRDVLGGGLEIFDMAVSYLILLLHPDLFFPT